MQRWVSSEFIKYECLFIATGCTWLPSQEGRQVQPVNKQMIQFFLSSQYRCSFLLQFLFPEEGFQIIIISIYNRDIHLHIVHFSTCAMQ